MNPLPPDPYLALGVSKTAQLSDIRSAHRKLVLKCHPDKVQDAALKAAKQDEFQKVQQAYELLSNETQRAQYDAQVKLNELRKELGRGAPVGAGPGAGANVYTAEPRTTSAAYRPRPATQTYSRYESDESRFSTPRRSGSYETKSKSTTKDEDRRARRKEEEREARRDAELKREKEVLYTERKKSREKDRRKASEDKSRNSYIERSESDSDGTHRPTRSTPRIRLADLVDMVPKTSRRAAEVVDTVERRREKTKANIEHAYRYMKAARGGTSPAEPPRSAKVPYVPDSPVIETIEEEEDTVRRASGRTQRRTSVDTPSTSRRPQNSSRSRESPRLSSKDKKRSDPRIVDGETRIKPTLSSQKSAPPEVSSSREKLQRSSTMDTKYNSKNPPIPTSLPRASTFHGSENGKSRSTGSKHRAAYESVSESDSELDSPPYVKQASPTRERPPIQKTSSYKIVRDMNGQRAERVHDLNGIYEEPRERSLSPRRTAANYARTSSSRPANSRAPQSQPFYVPSQSIPAARALSPEREVPNVKTVRPGMRETQSHYTKKSPATWEDVKVNFSPNYGREDIAYSQDSLRRSSDPDSLYMNYPATNQAFKREEIAPRKAMYAS